MSKPETYKATRWRITYTNKMGRKYKMRFTYGPISFDTQADAEREKERMVKNHDPRRSSNEDYQVESYEANVLVKPIYPFAETETEEDA